MAKKLTIESVQLKRGTAAVWTAKNPVLKAGEPGLETDTLKLKFGDGVKAWNDLTYFAGDGGLEPPVDRFVDKVGASLPAAAEAAGETFLNTADGKLYTADENKAWDAGMPLANGARLACSADKKIYTVKDNKATGYGLEDGVIFFCRTGAKAWVFNQAGNAFVEVGEDLEAVIDGGVITTEEG